MATLLDGKRILKDEFVEYIRSHTEPCGVNIKIFHYIKTCDLFIKELSNYTQQKRSVVYGITRSINTNRYVIVIPDEFSSRRNNSKRNMQIL